MSQLPSGSTILVLAAHLVAGLALGAAYFHSLHWTSNRLAAGRGAAGAAAATIGRFVLLGGVLTLTSLEGAPHLLLTALGVLIARAVVLRRARVAAA